jgi:hyperosmotically inducible protein
MTQKQILSVCILVLLALVAFAAVRHAGAQDKGEGFSDALISERVKAAINSDAALSKMNIRIEVRDAVVHLRGFVASMADVAKAESIVRAVQGVTAVRNTIRVENRPARA